MSTIYNFLCEMVGKDVSEHKHSTKIVNVRDKRKNITSKLFLDENLASFFHEIDPTYSFTLARIFRDEFILNEFHIQDMNLESIHSTKIRTETIYRKHKIAIDSTCMQERSNILEISHFLASESSNSINSKTLDWGKAIALAKVHHIDISNNSNVESMPYGFKREDEIDGEIFINFPDGWYWVNTLKEYSKEEAAIMQHCGRDSGTHILSLRDPSGESHITASRDPKNKTIRQCRGKKNQKPSRKYHEYICGLLLNKTFPILDIGSNNQTFELNLTDEDGPIDYGYGSFQLMDLSWNSNLLALVIEHSPLSENIAQHVKRIVINRVGSAKPDNLKESLDAMMGLGFIKSYWDVISFDFDFIKILQKLATRPTLLFNWCTKFAELLGIDKFNSSNLKLDSIDHSILYALFISGQQTSKDIFSKFIEDHGCNIESLLSAKAKLFSKMPSIFYKYSNNQENPSYHRSLLNLLSTSIIDEDIFWIDIISKYDTNAALINEIDADGLSALHRIFAGNTQIFEVLEAMLNSVAKNPNVNYNVRSPNGKLPIHFTIFDPTQMISPQITHLLSKGCDIDAVDDMGRTTLSYAVEHERYDAIGVLLNNGANPEIQSLDGENVLHIAVRIKSKKMIEYLINNTNIRELIKQKNKDGLTPMEYEKSLKHTNLSTLLSLLNIIEVSDINRVLENIIVDNDANTLNDMCKNSVISKKNFTSYSNMNLIHKMVECGSIDCLFLITQKFNIPIDEVIVPWEFEGLNEYSGGDLQMIDESGQLISVTPEMSFFHNYRILSHMTNIQNLQRYIELASSVIKKQKEKIEDMNRYNRF